MKINRKKLAITVLKGDGIGPEIIDQGLRLMSIFPLTWHFNYGDIGLGSYKLNGNPLPAGTIKKCRTADAVLFGAVTTPLFLKDYVSPIVRLRQILGLYANVRPCYSFERKPKKIDLVIVRENTEGLYSGIEHRLKGGAVAERVITVKACRKIIEFAFKYAADKGRQKITLVHKANILRLTDGLFLKIGRAIAAKHPGIDFEDILIDTAALNLVRKPQTFDVMVTTNMFGDILSDEAAGLTGGLGMAAAANIGRNTGLFEPVHGSCPKYQGKNIANPFACFLAIALMFDYLGLAKFAGMIRTAVAISCQRGLCTHDLGGQLSTTAATESVIKIIRSEYAVN
ncbi:MAG: isocitrate/isopropylmalate dehydrogenase family protein, homoisocitrate dehydrogenase [Candidatus Gottesmanbacteria bacterium GW2011_GWA2_43_14]|uniref:Isocitrate/isopropylmalate dehydrogenase family protein, homoisocitrate dehydrogenase n=1 Tax=Candidatus Gottesmanbacteria bacterium GW2011_GWA2_43_14 TaxID=1618443 RepID=A0A0G1DMH2_9BACT|nr:MAG: isocitrate/isopropylmalate dehydrogenase family protein, homoisocitrate dehydrogenase [Candidatus Gottesmanbacteria bacterium GW2011_GWA2_43_14]